VIIQSDIPVDNNNKILEDENTTKDQNFGWYLCRGVILTKDIIAKRNWYQNMYFLSSRWDD
jgi:hypothetical protein